MNYSDSERIASVLENIGYQPSSNQNEADLIVVNACSVRQSAIDRIFGITTKFGSLRRKNKKLKTILTGCVLPTDKKKLSEKFDLFLDIKDLPKLPQMLNAECKIGRKKRYLEIKPLYQSPFSANLPIMTGCNNFCSYCAVPYTRGKEISRPAEDIICEIKNLIKRDYKEIWLLGQNVNSYKNGKINFPKLLKMVNNTPGNFWIRFTSSHPKDFSDELIEIMAKCKKITPYLNLPVQSGDNEILKKMNRPYAVKHYKNLIKKIRVAFTKNREGLEQNLSISTDVIVGFPGETKEQFKNTAKLFNEIKYDMAYISQYSPRPGTTAAKVKNNVSKKEKIRRWKIINNILKRTAMENNKKYIGKETEVLIDNQKRGFLTGKNRQYKTVKIKAEDNNLIGKFIKVKITNALPWGLNGELL